MQLSVMTSDTGSPLVLPEVLDLAAAEDFLALMQRHLGNGSPLHIDASVVQTLTLPCAQIILSATRTYDGISIERPSDAFVSAFEDLAIDWKQDLARNPDLTVSPVSPMPAPDEQQDEMRQAEPEPMDESVMSKRILTIDDSKTMRDMLMLTLADAGFDVLQAVDGQDGLDVLVNEKVDVVITDINMPRMDGYEVIRNLRRNPDHKTTPILVLTTESEASKKNLAREAGATGWMVKPFDPDRLISTIRKVAP